MRFEHWQLLICVSLTAALSLGCGQSGKTSADGSKPNTSSSKSTSAPKTADSAKTTTKSPADVTKSTRSSTKTQTIAGGSPESAASKQSVGANPALMNPKLATLKAPAEFTVRLETTQGPADIRVTRAWAPQGADRFFNLVKAGYYTDVAFFRVIEGFMAQVGISGNPAVTKAWRGTDIKDDKVARSNTRGMVSFASRGPNTRTTQFFINFGNNNRLDGMGFSPFGFIDAKSMKVIDALYNGYGEGAPRGRGPSQARLTAEGNSYLRSDFKQLDYIKSATVVAVSSASTTPAGSSVAAKTDSKKATIAPLKTPTADAATQAPAQFSVILKTTKGDIQIDLTRSWAPNGVDRFHQLVKAGYYTDVAFFRVIKGFMAQTGLHGDPAVTAAWRQKPIKDDPVKKSNRRGMVTFATAGPNTRTTQFFINFADRNAFLDRQGFSPIGQVAARSMSVVDALNSEYGEGAPRGRGPNQSTLNSQGNAYLKREFPRLDYIKSASIIPSSAKR